MKRILVLGASGRTGKFLLESALTSGYEVTALVRNPAGLQIRNNKLTIIKGSPYRLTDVENAMRDNEAVLVALNNPRTSDMPWAKPAGAPDIITKSVGNALLVMKEHNVNRIIVLSAFGVGDSFALAPWLTRLFIQKTNLKVVYRDHENTEALLRQSTVNWTTVRPVALSNSTDLRTLKISYDQHLPLSATISRKQVGNFMLSILDEPALFGKTPNILEK